MMPQGYFILDTSRILQGYLKYELRMHQECFKDGSPWTHQVYFKYSSVILQGSCKQIFTRFQGHVKNTLKGISTMVILTLSGPVFQDYNCFNKILLTARALPKFKNSISKLLKKQTLPKQNLISESFKGKFGTWHLQEATEFYRRQSQWVPIMWKLPLSIRTLQASEQVDS